jgi:hypothetical protein
MAVARVVPGLAGCGVRMIGSTGLRLIGKVLGLGLLLYLLRVRWIWAKR